MSHLFIGIIAPSCILIPLFIGFRKGLHQHAALRYLMYYLFLSGAINFLAILLSYNGQNNLPLLHLLTLVEMILLSLFYGCLLEPKHARIIKRIGIAAAAISLLNSLFIQGLFAFNSYARGMLAILVICYSLLFLLRAQRVAGLPGAVFLVTGCMIYYGGSVFLFLFSNFLESGTAGSTLIWNVNAALTVILYILLSIGLKKCTQQPTISMSYY